MATSSLGVGGSARYGDRRRRGSGRSQIRVDGEHVGAQPGPGGQEGDPLGGRLQAQVEHALVDLHGLDGPFWRAALKWGSSGDGVEGDEAEHHLAHLAGGAEQADVGAAVGHDGQVVRSERQMARTAAIGLRRDPQPPMPMVMPAAQLADQVVDGGRLSVIGALIPHCEVSASRFSTKAARCSSATPPTWSS